MIPAAFAYERPESLAEALELLRRPDAHPLAGGQSLLPAMKVRRIRPELLVDIARVPGLGGIDRRDGQIAIGAMVTQREIEDSARLAETFPMLAEAADVVADPAVRSQGTLAGSLAFADPAGDWPAIALALGARIGVVGPDGEQHLPIDSFFQDSYRTGLPLGSLITHVDLPEPQPRTGMVYRKIRHPASGYCLVGVAVVITLDDTGICRHCRIALTGAGRKAVRAQESERTLIGHHVDAANIRAAAEIAPTSLELTADLYASAPYRAHLATVETERTLRLALERCVARQRV